ncbi:DUF6510 family protein [Nonomuraea sp. NPDC047529]|uniref:DUF6510 family protein n=1 Tax=Nonomuraea sp. NPDC047529 TaxID=3155623 RepID=UPI0033EA4C61
MQQPVDGNAAAGLLAQFFGRDMTAAQGVCAQCGMNGPLGEATVYGPAPGTVLRCPNCDNVLMTLVEAPGRMMAAMPGLSMLETSVQGGR